MATKTISALITYAYSLSMNLNISHHSGSMEKLLVISSEGKWPHHPLNDPYIPSLPNQPSHTIPCWFSVLLFRATVQRREEAVWGQQASSLLAVPTRTRGKQKPSGASISPHNASRANATWATRS